MSQPFFELKVWNCKPHQSFINAYVWVGTSSPYFRVQTFTPHFKQTSYAYAFRDIYFYVKRRKYYNVLVARDWIYQTLLNYKLLFIFDICILKFLMKSSYFIISVLMLTRAIHFCCVCSWKISRIYPDKLWVMVIFCFLFFSFWPS